MNILEIFFVLRLALVYSYGLNAHCTCSALRALLHFIFQVVLSKKIKLMCFETL